MYMALKTQNTHWVLNKKCDEYKCHPEGESFCVCRVYGTEKHRELGRASQTGAAWFRAVGLRMFLSWLRVLPVKVGLELLENSGLPEPYGSQRGPSLGTPG